MEVRTRYLFIILAVGTLLFLFNLGGRDLWEPDETRYAVVAREMVQRGNWILPHLNGDIYAEKPPLFFWLVNLSTFFGGGEFRISESSSICAGGVDYPFRHVSSWRKTLPSKSWIPLRDGFGNKYFISPNIALDDVRFSVHAPFPFYHFLLLPGC